MNGNNLFFKIHYCNGRKITEDESNTNKAAGIGIKKLTKQLKHHELLYITEGKGSILLEKKKYPLKKGMLFYLCPDVTHSITLEMEEPTYFLSVHFSYALVTFNDNVWDIKGEEGNLSFQPIHELTDYYQVEDIFKKLVDSWNAKSPGYEFLTKTLLCQLMIAINQNIKNQNQNFSISLKVEKVIEYLHQNIHKKVTLQELSDLVHVSLFYLSRAFKNSTGYTVIEYFNKIKIDKAKELMIESDKKIKDIAQVVGFGDEFYFSRIFKKVEGISPSEFYSKYVHGN
jgi:AraC-like DNA-binding protein